MAYEIRQNLTNANYNSRGSNPSWIVIHNTANGTSREGTAWANTNYFKDVVRNASATYFIDDGNVVWQCVRDTDTAWHCGESASRNGCYNSNSIGIEVCEQADGSFSEHEINVLSWLVPMLMRKYGIPASRVCRHHDVTGKICPAGYIDAGRWNWLKGRITTGQQEDEVTPQDINNIALAVWAFNHNGIQMRDRIQGIDVAANGANNKLAETNIGEQVWAFPVADVQARDRLYGIDMAANATKILDELYFPAIMDALNRIAAKQGIDTTGLAEEVREAVKQELEKIELNVNVRK